VSKERRRPDIVTRQVRIELDWRDIGPNDPIDVEGEWQHHASVLYTGPGMAREAMADFADALADAFRPTTRA
jgi:hypothetical protein